MHGETMRDAEHIFQFKFSNKANYWDVSVQIFVSHRFPWTVAYPVWWLSSRLNDRKIEVS